VPASDVQWILNFSDGSGNQYTVTSAGAEGPGRLVYNPVTPEESSSGVYSGGSPADVQISSENTSELWRRVLALEQNTARHAKGRSMGSGSFRTKTVDGNSRFLMSMGAELGDFTTFISSLRPAAQR
jgi:hypothetical protein